MVGSARSTLLAGGQPFRPRPSSAWAGPLHHKPGKQTITDEEAVPEYVVTMPWGLHRFQETGQLHFLTFSVTTDDQTSRTLPPGLRSRLPSKGYDNATDFASTAMS